MDDDEALRLNTLHRFRKHSPRLLLEEYSHCEVPAGCGGVVMRWVDPRVGTPAVVRTFTEAQITLWLDGRSLDSSRLDLAAGSHTLALEWARADAGRLPAPLMLIIERAARRDGWNGDRVIVLLSTHDHAAWRLSGEPPPSSWIEPEFDDASWAVAERFELDAELRSNFNVQTLMGRAVLPLAVPHPHAWLRVRFEVPELQVEDQS